MRIAAVVRRPLSPHHHGRVGRAVPTCVRLISGLLATSVVVIAALVGCEKQDYSSFVNEYGGTLLTAQVNPDFTVSFPRERAINAATSFIRKRFGPPNNAIVSATTERVFTSSDQSGRIVGYLVSLRRPGYPNAPFWDFIMATVVGVRGVPTVASVSYQWGPTTAVAVAARAEEAATFDWQVGDGGSWPGNQTSLASWRALVKGLKGAHETVLDSKSIPTCFIAHNPSKLGAAFQGLRFVGIADGQLFTLSRTNQAVSYPLPSGRETNKFDAAWKAACTSWRTPSYGSATTALASAAKEHLEPIDLAYPGRYSPWRDCYLALLSSPRLTNVAVYNRGIMSEFRDGGEIGGRVANPQLQFALSYAYELACGPASLLRS